MKEKFEIGDLVEDSNSFFFENKQIGILLIERQIGIIITKRKIDFITYEYDSYEVFWLLENKINWNFSHQIVKIQ